MVTDNRIYAIGRRYKELRQEGVGKEIYDIIRKEFGDCADTTIRSYASYVKKRSHKRNDLLDYTTLKVTIPTKILDKALKLAQSNGTSLDSMISNLLLDYLLRD